MPFRAPGLSISETVKPRKLLEIKSVTADTGTGFFARGEAFRFHGIKTYFDWYEREGAVRSGINGLAEGATGFGYETVPPSDEEGDLPSEWERAKRLVDEFGEAMNLDSLLPNICRCMLIAGFVGVETQIKKYPSKCALKIIHPKTIREVVPDKHGNVSKLVQVVNSKEVTISGKNITWFVNSQIANNLKGTSLVAAVQELLMIKQVVIDNIGKIAERRLAPRIIWKSMRDLGGIKAAVEELEANEDLFMGNLTPEEMRDIAQIIEVAGDSKYWEYIEYIDRLVYVGLYAPDLYYWRNATEASARVLSEMVDRHISAIQRNMKRGVEAGFFARLMKANGINVVPRLEWSVKKTGFEDLDIQLIILEGLRLGYVGPDNLQVLIDQSGLDIGKLGAFGLPEPLEDPAGEPEEPEDEEGEEPLERLIE